MSDAALDLMNAMVLENGRRWGEVAAPVQRRDAGAVLSDTGPRRHWLGRPRGFAKTADAGGLALALMLSGELPSGSRCFSVASDADQARLMLDSLAGMARRTPEIAGAVTVGANRIVVAGRDVELRIVPADAASAFGLRPHLVVADELAMWPTSPNARNVWVAVTSALPKVDGSRLVVTTTAGSPGHWAHDVFKAAQADTGRWRVSMTSDLAPWMSAAEVAAERAHMPDSLWRRLYRNEWTTAEDSLVAEDDLAAAMCLDGPQPPVRGGRYVAAVDLGLVNDATAIAVGHVDGSGRVVVDRRGVWRGTRAAPVDLGQVEEWLATTCREYAPCRIVADPWQSAQLLSRLRSRGFRAEGYPFTSQSVGRLGVGLHLALRDRRLLLPVDADLREELANVRLRESSPGLFRLDHASSGHDDQAVSCALLVDALTSRPSGRLSISSAAGMRMRPAESHVAALTGPAAGDPDRQFGPPPAAARDGDGDGLARHIQAARRHPGYRRPGTR